MIELLVASGLFSLFLGGVFLLYRSGTNMFLSGSWKLNKQKEAERFLAVLKSRLEQATNLTRIDPDQGSSQQVVTVPAPIHTLQNGVSFTPAAKPEKVLAFTVCKPDLTHPKINGPKGLRLPHVLWLVPRRQGTGELQLLATTLPSASMTTTVNFPPDFGSLTPEGFSALPADYQLGPEEFQIELSDVASITISWATASGTGLEPGGKTLGLTVAFRNPDHPQTTFDQTVEARISPDVPIYSYPNLGDF